MKISSKDKLQKYERNINNVINYISENISKTITLNELSIVACFSKYHFHRIFKALVTENVNEFMRRLQLIKAAFMFIFHASSTIVNIAFDCGFSSSQNFAKAFKSQYKVTPSEFRNNKNSNNLTQ